MTEYRSYEGLRTQSKGGDMLWIYIEFNKVGLCNRSDSGP